MSTIRPKCEILQFSISVELAREGLPYPLWSRLSVLDLDWLVGTNPKCRAMWRLELKLRLPFLSHRRIHLAMGSQSLAWLREKIHSAAGQHVENHSFP